jgi:shikimate kinase
VTSASPARRHVVLIGMMGSGKTTTGQALAQRLGWPMRDCDADLEAREGRTGAQIVAGEGVDRLHELEEQVLLDALAADEPAVVAAAGWVVESERCRRAITERAYTVWLDAPVDELLPRMATGAHRRPLARGSAEDLLARRREWFAELADLRLDAWAPTTELVERILPELVRRP